MLKNIKLFTNHAAYEAAKNSIDKPNVVKCQQENEVHYAAVGSVTLITFNISSKSYQAEEGMTWQQWVDSSYNTDGYIIASNYVMDSQEDIWVSNSTNWGENYFVSSSATIIENYVYAIQYVNDYPA